MKRQAVEKAGSMASSEMCLTFLLSSGHHRELEGDQYTTLHLLFLWLKHLRQLSGGGISTGSRERLKQRTNTRSPLSFFLNYILRFENSLATSILEQWSKVNFRDCWSRIVCNTEPPWKSTLNFLAGVANIISITQSWAYFLGPFWHFRVTAAAVNKTMCRHENHPSCGGHGWSWPLWVQSSSFTSTPNNDDWIMQIVQLKRVTGDLMKMNTWPTSVNGILICQKSGRSIVI